VARKLKDYKQVDLFSNLASSVQSYINVNALPPTKNRRQLKK